MALYLKDRPSSPALASINFCENYSFFQKYMAYGVSKGRVDNLHEPMSKSEHGTPRFSSDQPSHYTTIHVTTCKIESISTKTIIVRKLDYHTSEEPVDLFLTTLLVCTRQQ